MHAGSYFASAGLTFGGAGGPADWSCDNGRQPMDPVSSHPLAQLHAQPRTPLASNLSKGGTIINIVVWMP